jgi:hypothetical protein
VSIIGEQMKIYYLDNPRLEPFEHRGKTLMRLTEDWCFAIDDKKYWIPKGYFYDGASIPRIFWSVIGSPFEPDFWAGALAHDWLYFTHFVTRQVADEVLYQILRQSGVGIVRAKVIWSAVRTCAGFAWELTPDDLSEMQCLKRAMSDSPNHAKYGL